MSSDLNSKCRTCLCDTKNYHQLFDYVEENYEIIEMLDSMVPQIDIRTKWKFCTLICQSCVDKLLAGYKFQQLCIETNYRLHGLLVNECIETEEEKIMNPWTDGLIHKFKYESVGDEYVGPVTEIESGGDNGRIGSGGSPTLSSNENPSPLNKKLPIKLENIKHREPEMNQLTKRKAKYTKHISLDDIRMLDMEKTSRKGKHFCKECGKKFNGLFLLKRHSSVHLSTKPFECEICKYRFDKVNILKLHLARHKKEANTQSRPEFFNCPFCPKSFEKQESLSGHLHMHKHNSSAANYLCKVCHRSFMSAKTLTEHITNQHPEAEKHKCDQCDKTFVLHGRLLEHINRHNGNKNLVCIICEKEFFGFNNMKEHMRTHRSLNRRLCPQCGVELCNTSSLRRHMKNHALKKYQCPNCPSRFDFKDHMTEHMHTHNLEKTHPCLQCGKKLSSGDCLRRHIKSTNV